MKKNKISDIGREKEFLKNILPRLSKSESLINGFGHDASVIKTDHNLLLAQKIDRAAKPFAILEHLSNYESWGHFAL